MTDEKDQVAMPSINFGKRTDQIDYRGRESDSNKNA